MKKICMAELLGGRTLDKFLPVRDEEIETFLKGMLRKSQASESVDVGQELTALANHIISRMTISKRCLATSDEAGEVRAWVDEVGVLTGKLKFQDYIWFCKNVDIQGLGKRLQDVHLRSDAMMEGILKEHEEARNNAGMIQWALGELINHPDLLNRATEEIDSITGNKRLVKESDVPNLHYVQAIVEDQRFTHQPFFFFFHKRINSAPQSRRLRHPCKHRAHRQCVVDRQRPLLLGKPNGFCAYEIHN